ncbi:MAG: hypothetical protein A2284_14645 [Deltaproteobacteria bacterium RIFOXYA12_FULL_61_11]|nr:MAG: hypothetical protein A2284_14645 [Deltaproteobacteria bacterium RIFOXYA12_FULL_61_11]
MKLLLDTHILLWSLLDPDRLTPEVRALLQDEKVEVWYSPITLWEILLLGQKARVILRPDPETFVRDMLVTVPLREAPLSGEIAIRSRNLALPHEDPADRFLIATALVYELDFATADDRILSARPCRILAC